MRLHYAFLVVFLISACGLGYQLIAGSVSSYLLGDSVTQFSFTIGIYLAALGLGSFLTRYLEVVRGELDTRRSLDEIELVPLLGAKMGEDLSGEDDSGGVADRDQLELLVHGAHPQGSIR